MPHVGIERLRAGNGEEDAAEHDEADRAMEEQEGQSRKRAQRAQYAPGRGNVGDAENRVDGEEHDHDRSEKRRDAGRAATLREEQQNENHDGRRQDETREFGVHLLEPLQRREHRYRGRDDRVAGK